MSEDPVSVRPEADLHEVRDLMDGQHIRHLPVTDEEGLVIGLVSQRDLIRHALTQTDEQTLSLQEEILSFIKVRDIMTRDVECVEPDQDIELAAQLMLDNKYGCVPVVEAVRLVGILTESDFVKLVREGARV
jgi:CBS domain-containing membrane protein